MLRREPAAAEHQQPDRCAACRRQRTRLAIQHVADAGAIPLCVEVGDCIAHCRKVGIYCA